MMKTTSSRVLWPNIGGEEGDASRFAEQPAVARTRELWTALFEAEPALTVLGETGGLVPWLADASAESQAERLGLPLWGPSAAVVAQVHDKAFAIAHARDHGFEPAGLRHCSQIFEPADLDDPEAFARAVREACQTWPTGVPCDGFALKPRWGTSGRGRVGGPTRSFDPIPVRGAARRLARRRGAILEPWLDRVTDLSVVAWISPPDGPGTSPSLTLIAALEQVVSASGLWLGHRGEIDRRGRIYSGTPWDDDMREATASVAEAARAIGFHGPCGLDGFAFRDAGPRLRPIVEFNARFTMGHVCAGWVRRLMPQVIESFQLDPGRRISFLFALMPPSEAGWHDLIRQAGVTRFDLAARADARADESPTTADGPSGPLLLFHEDPEPLAALAQRLRRRGPDRAPST